MAKEIIIDGINVSECGFFHPEYDTDCHIALAFSEEYEGCMKCENNPNCNFKKRKRAEQKLEKIKEIVSYCTEQVWCIYCKYEDECGTDGTHLNNMILQIIEGEENV